MVAGIERRQHHNASEAVTVTDLSYWYTPAQVRDHLINEYGTPNDIAQLVANTIHHQRTLTMEATRVAFNTQQAATAILDCVADNDPYSTEDIAVAVDDLARLAGELKHAHKHLTDVMTVAQHVIGERGHEAMMDVTAMVEMRRT